MHIHLFFVLNIALLYICIRFNINRAKYSNFNPINIEYGTSN